MKDLDDLFSYNTPKIVRVRDRRLGIPYYVAMLCIFGYILYTIIADQRYLKTEEPGGGSIRTTLEVPKDIDNNREDNEPATMGSKTIQWLYWNPNQIVYPAGQDGCLFITTRVTERNIVYKDSDAINDSECNPLLPTKRKCRTTTSSKANIYYIADVEDMTIMVEHTIRGNLLPITEVNKKLYGELLDHTDKKVMWRFYPKNYEYDMITTGNYTIRPDDIPGDVFSVGTLLDAAGFALEDINNNDEPYRYSGCVIVVIIEYNNRQEAIEYKYKPSLIEKAEMKILELVTDVDYVSSKLFNKVDADNSINESVGWVEYNRHGIEIKFVQLGNIGKFDFMALCMNLVASIAMLSVASTIVESLMLYVLPEKGDYRNLKYLISEDFSDFRYIRHLICTILRSKYPGGLTLGEIKDELDVKIKELNYNTNGQVINIDYIERCITDPKGGDTDKITKNEDKYYCVPKEKKQNSKLDGSEVSEKSTSV